MGDAPLGHQLHRIQDLRQQNLVWLGRRTLGAIASLGNAERALHSGRSPPKAQFTAGASLSRITKNMSMQFLKVHA
ncbi:hypothetical protein HW132_06520 [Brasilonema sp. CT11]|nr:hypothetical protein [Brasilonema sp. CT11]